MKLRWKMEARETGLRAVCADPRGYYLHDGKQKYATVSIKRKGWARNYEGWYWVAGWGSGVPHKNTCDLPCNSIEEAKNQAAEYVKFHLGK